VKPSRIQAVDHVNIEAPPEAAEEIRWFYGELAELDEIPSAPGAETLLRFRSADLEVRVHLVSDPCVDPMEQRLVIAIPSLFSAKQLLDERHIVWQEFRGLGWTDRRLALLDPGGNRIELKQQWPEGPF